MKIILANGTELSPVSIIGEKRYVSGAQRDAIVFAFPADTSLDEMDSIFSAENCETIIIADDEGEYLHKAYTVRAELNRIPVEVSPATESSEAVYENRVTVCMAQRTYAESQLAALAQQNAMLEECIVEMAQAVYA